MTRVVVTGGRDFTEREWMWDGLNELHVAVGGITELIEGGARGADRCAAQWVNWINEVAGCVVIDHRVVPADWAEHGRSAGYKRNVAMADLNPDYVFVAPGGKGTAMMVDIAKQRGISRIYLENMRLPRLREPLAVPRAP